MKTIPTYAYVFAGTIVVLGTYIACIPSTQTPSANSTAYFNDVTATHLPQAPKLHSLDAAFGDVDMDGDLDIVIAVENDVNRLYLNDGSGKFTRKEGVFRGIKADSEHVRLTDFNDDGKLDAVFVAEDDQTPELYLGNGDGTFRDLSDYLPAKSEGNGLAVGDVNADGLPDILVGNSGSKGQDFLWLNNRRKPGSFTDATSSNLPQINDSTQDIKLADLDGDGDLDMIIGNEIPPNRLYVNNGKGVFTERAAQLELLVPLHTRESVLFDADGDGDKDILFANLTNNGGQWEKDPQTRLLINNGKGVFKDETGKRMPSNKFSTYAANVIDFDNDGDEDILLSAVKIPGFSPDKIRAYSNNGNGVFTDVSTEVIPEGTEGRSWGICIGDVNKDGINDVFIGGWGTQARLLLGKKNN
ncbi:MAG TPA: VCBS repeat-containing protein [Daejeonella sp.]